MGLTVVSDLGISTGRNMKLASFIIGLAAADKASIDKQILSYVGNSSLRVFTGNIANAIQNFDEYGCWCFFYDNVGRGKGTPVDELDGFCKTLADGYACIALDNEIEGAEDCIPWEVHYNPGGGAGRDRHESCTIANPGASNCAIRACSVEGIFVDNVFAMLLSGAQADFEQFSHAQGFDNGIYAGCPTYYAKTGIKVDYGGEKACCGHYPNRFPFKTLQGGRACCGSRTYSTDLMNCCANGQIKANC